MSATEAAQGGEEARLLPQPDAVDALFHAAADSRASTPLSEGDDETGNVLSAEIHDGSNGLKEESDSDAVIVASRTTLTTLRPDPLPSKRRRESEAHDAREAVDFHSHTEPAAPAKKRKRGASPPWQFPTAEATTLKTADGRRISARVHTNTPPVSSDNDTKRARSSSVSATAASRNLSKVESPPWKKFAAEGPTAVVVDGKRKSGRVNKELNDTPKRVSPRSKKVEDKVKPSPVSPAKLKVTTSSKALQSVTNGVNGVNGGASSRRTVQAKDSSNMHSASGSATKIAKLRAQIAALKSPDSAPSSPEPIKYEPAKSHKRKHSSNDRMKPTQLDGPISPTVRPTNSSATATSQPDHTSPRIRLRFSVPRYVVPSQHPHAQPPSPIRPPRLSISQALESAELKEAQQPYMENERGPPQGDWFTRRAERAADDEGALRKRILLEAEPGGRLSKEQLSIYQDIGHQNEPAKQYGHHDHVVAHALYLRQLQIREKQAHRVLAKKVAYEALERWKDMRGPTEEDLIAEQIKISRLIHKQVVADVKAKWEMVGAYVQRQRLLAWEQQEETKRQERLREKLERSEHLIARLRGEDEDSDGIDDEEGSPSDQDSEGSADTGSEEENMSDSESGDEAGTEADADEESVQDMEEDDVKNYLAQRSSEVPLQESAEQQNPHILDLKSPPAGPNPADLPIDPTPDSADAEPPDNNETAESPPAGALEADSDIAVTAADASPVQTTALSTNTRTRSARQTGEQVELDDADLDSDTSTDMDSEDYDSDEDVSSSESDSSMQRMNEDQSDAGTADVDIALSTGVRSLVSGTSLGNLFKREIVAADAEQRENLAVAGLPTPTTSAEGDEGDADASVDEHPGNEGDVDDRGADDVDTATISAEHALASKTDVSEEHTLHNDAMPITAPASPTGSAEDVEDVEDAGPKYSVPSPMLLRGTLRSYQHAGLDWLASLYRNGTNGILADEMGLGKTIQTIALLAHLAEQHACWETHLVIVPTSVVLNWVTEFQRFLPGFRILGYYGSNEERVIKRKGWTNDPHHEDRTKRGYNVIIMSYNVAMADINMLRNVQWHYLVLDEAHNIRNFNSQRWQKLIRLKTHARLLLTGTPLQNSLTELWSLLTFLTAGDDDPQHGDLEEFLSHWKEPVKEIFDRGVASLSSEAQRVVDQLHVSLRPFLLRRLKSEVEKDLPKKTESVVVCKLSKRQRQLYQTYMGLADTRRSLTQGNAVTAGKVLLSLRRVCNHPDLFDPRRVETAMQMETSVVADFAGRETMLRRMLGQKQILVVNVVDQERSSKYVLKRANQLNPGSKLDTSAVELEQLISSESKADPTTLHGSRIMQRVRLRERKLEQLRSCIQASKRSLLSAPMYGTDLRELLTIQRDRAYRVRPKSAPGRAMGGHLRGLPALGRFPLRSDADHMSDWLLSRSSVLQQSVHTADNYAANMHNILTRFMCYRTEAQSPILDYVIPPEVQRSLRASSPYPSLDIQDYAHEARMRRAVIFPDSRLLIYDSGKLQRLTYLLRELQSRGLRSLIFTQMTGTLNILEQFLGLLNLPYLRLDGSTPVERRQLYSAEFNRPDSKYQCMILSSRAGGVGLNLTGASSVIFYDLDWNPQMDRQCMDRAHRIGQVRDVEVYKMVSEKTVEENILRRAEQKSLLDRAVIQEGHFTTEWKRETETAEDDDDVALGIERFLGNGDNEKATNLALESVEDREDVVAAAQARKEEQQEDADFVDRPSKGPSGPPTPGHQHGEMEGDAAGEDDESNKRHLDLWLIRQMEFFLKDVVFVPPQARKLDKHGRDASHRKRKR